MFHLITHAFFKALLFLGSGSVIHGCHEEQDIRHMGGLKKFMPVTFATYAVGMLALAGFPLFFSGFWSKDEILHAAHNWPVSHWPFYIGCAGALLTAFYMTRQVALVFFGEYRSRRGNEADHTAAHKTPPPHVGGYKEPHESPGVMTWPLIILAVCAVLLGVIGTPAWPWFESYLNGHHAGFNFSKLTEAGTLGLMLASAAIVFTGLGLGWWLYGKRQRKTAGEPDALQVVLPRNLALPDIFTALQNKWWIDEIYEATVIRFNAWFAMACDFMDRWVWGGAVLLVSGVMIGLAWLYRVTDEFVVNLGFDAGCEGIRRGGGGLSKLHTGRVQTYLRVIGVALVVLIIFLVWGRKA
jgi:NADH-quinone oxidoreductase subunit L